MDIFWEENDLHLQSTRSQGLRILSTDFLSVEPSKAYRIIDVFGKDSIKTHGTGTRDSEYRSPYNARLNHFEMTAQ
jgi:hypothetical protein